MSVVGHIYKVMMTFSNQSEMFLVTFMEKSSVFDNIHATKTARSIHSQIFFHVHEVIEARRGSNIKLVSWYRILDLDIWLLVIIWKYSKVMKLQEL